MKIAMIGAGYVGLVSGACFADMGVDVTIVDTNAERIEKLRKGIMPIYEQGLEELVERNSRAQRLHFTTDTGSAIEGAEVVFIAVGTPPESDGSADVHFVEDAARQLGALIDHYTIVAVKSTVPPGTCRAVKQIIDSELQRRGVDTDRADVVSNPEFLKEGVAIKDFMSPDRVVVGVESDRARAVMDKLYKPFMLVSYRMQFTDTASAEIIKYASNAMLATRISFMNDIANLCERVGADVAAVRRGVGADTRIGNKFLYPGCGYGGSCFPKDVRALSATAARLGYRMEVLEAVDSVNRRQKELLFKKVCELLGVSEDVTLSGRTVTLWGAAFKPETDDVREAPSIKLIDSLLSAGAKVRVCDPEAGDNIAGRYGPRVELCADRYEALAASDCMVLVTEWKEYRMPNYAKMKELMRTACIVDGRNIYDRHEVESAGFAYSSIGYSKPR